ACGNDFKNVLVVPNALIPEILCIMHDCLMNGGHLGIRKTFERVKQRFYWRTMMKDVVRWVTSCKVCQQVKHYKNKSGKLMPIPPGDRPFSQIGLDVIGMLPTTARGNRFIIVVICYLTKYAITKAVKQITARDIADFLMKDVILQYSAFDILISDNGLNFRSEIIKELVSLMKAKHRFTTTYKPSTAGLVERFNRQIIQLLKSYLSEDVREWDVLLPYVTHMYNVSYHASTKSNPFYLTRGYFAKLPIDMYIEDQSRVNKDQSVGSQNSENNLQTCKNQFVYEISINLQKAREIAKKNIENAQSNYKKYYDSDKNTKEFEIGEKCLVHYPIQRIGYGNKLYPKWIGPFTIVHKINSLVYEVEADDGKMYLDRIHISKMKPYVERNKNDASTLKQNNDRPKRTKQLPKYLFDYYLGSK
ncbi:gag-pol fusion protein-like protein, partial [Dinothrombium tinctorium]